MFRRNRVVVPLVIAGVLILSAVHAGAQEEPYAPDIDAVNFVQGVDHLYFPLKPGTTQVYEEQTEDGLERIEFSVLPETREVLGIPSVVVRDTVWLDGEVKEDTFDWYAQDKEGNVWYMGEETREYENGAVVSTKGSWEAGVDGAQPGIIMQADPQVGLTYRQEYYAGEAEDMAEVVALNQSVSIGYGDFENVLVVKEWNPLEPGITEHKSYAPGVGLILEEVVEGGTGRVELAGVMTSDEADQDDGDDTGEESETFPGEMVITPEEALQFAEDQLGGSTAHEVELEYENGRWVYSIESSTGEISVDALTGEVLPSEADDD